MTNGKPRRERLTVEIVPEAKAAIALWADEERRPVGNLVRRLLASVASERRQGERSHAA